MGPEADEQSAPLTDFISLRIGVASRAFDNAAAEIFADLEIKPEHVIPLIVMAANPGRKQTEFAQMLSLDVTTFGRYADHLARQGLLNRRRSQQDRRAMLLRVTAKGEALAKRAGGLLQELEDRIVDALGRSSVSSLRSGLGAYTDTLAALRD